MAHFQVAQEMLITRGHTIIDYQFEKCLNALSTTNRDVIVIFIKQKFTITILKEILTQYDVDRYQDFIIVTPSFMSSNIKKTTKVNPNIEIFLEKELSFNILKHVIQPKMRRIPLVYYDRTYRGRDCYPIMLETDPVAKFMKWRNDDFIEITKKDDTVSYRIIKKIN
jgi:DNA-directed RNA polymerase subunit H (RpoH/RPB5)